MGKFERAAADYQKLKAPAGLRQKIIETAESEPAPVCRTVFPNWQRYAAAAACLVLVVSAALFFWRDDQSGICLYGGGQIGSTAAAADTQLVSYEGPAAAAYRISTGETDFGEVVLFVYEADGAYSIETSAQLLAVDKDGEYELVAAPYETEGRTVFGYPVAAGGGSVTVSGDGGSVTVEITVNADGTVEVRAEK